MRTPLRAPAPLAGIVAALAFVLLGCSTGGDGATSSSDAGSSAEAADAAVPGESTQDSGGTTARSPARVAVLQERAIIAVGTVSLASEDVQATRNAVQKVVDARRGEVTGEETQTSDEGEMTWSRLEVRVPSEDFAETMTDLERAGTLVNATRTAEDVTSQVIDTDARIRAQERSLRRIEVLLDTAGSLRDLVAVEAQLTRRQADLDSLKQQQAHLADQTSMSTITVHIEHDGDDEPPQGDDEPAGFVAGLKGGWSALATVGAGLATVAGAVLPFALVLALLGLPLWLGLRRLGHRRTPRSAG